MVDKYFENLQDNSKLFFCPGCKTHHRINKIWTIKYNGEIPTVTPSVLTKWDSGEERKRHVCHLFIKNGQIQYLNDCTHKLKGQTIDMETTNNG